MDDFLQNYEVAGGKMKPSLHGSGPEKLQSLRVAMGRDERVMAEDLDQEGAKDDDVYAAIEEGKSRERWDVETVLSRLSLRYECSIVHCFTSNIHEP
jgi:protein LTV1